MEEALIKRVMPHNIEAEQSVIGSMLMDKEAIMVASEIMTGEDFEARMVADLASYSTIVEELGLAVK